MSVLSEVNDFNETLGEFFQQIYIVTRDKDFLYYKNTLEKLTKGMGIIKPTKTMKEACIEQFAIHFLPHAHDINNSNEEAFLAMDIQNELKSHVPDEYKDASIMKVFELRKVWHTLTAENKKFVFEYMQTLIYYATEYVKKRYPELVDSTTR